MARYRTRDAKKDRTIRTLLGRPVWAAVGVAGVVGVGGIVGVRSTPVPETAAEPVALGPGVGPAVAAMSGRGDVHRRAGSRLPGCLRACVPAYRRTGVPACLHSYKDREAGGGVTTRGRHWSSQIWLVSEGAG